MSPPKFTPAERAQRYRERHPDRVKLGAQKFRETHREELRLRCKAWREKYPERQRQAQKSWIADNKDKRRATMRRWQIKNRDRLLSYSRDFYHANASRLRPKARAERAERKTKLVALLGGKCLDCGIVPHLAAFEFDHVGKKKINVSLLLNRKTQWEMALEEAKQCELVCANCHRVRTETRRK